eukprot:COSAG01_NODE_34150_length_552_cov_1.143488_1_plen_90_part_01
MIARAKQAGLPAGDSAPAGGGAVVTSARARRSPLAKDGWMGVDVSRSAHPLHLSRLKRLEVLPKTAQHVAAAAAAVRPQYFRHAMAAPVI